MDPLAAARGALKKYWGYAEFRPLQAEAIRAGIAGRDSLVVMPTGGGKSVCFQIPPVVVGRLDVVVSPLIALMKDQVDGLRASGYPAEALHSQLARDEAAIAERRIHCGEARLVFISPEKLFGSRIVDVLRRARVRAIAIDEAHCISHWGHDFRPEYRRLAELRSIFPEASMHAFTATATQRVRQDIAAQLSLRDPLMLVGDFDRPNLVYRVMPREDTEAQVLQIIRRHAGRAAIVYCITRRETEDLAEFLRGRGVRAEHYHAGMEAGDRRRAQERFSSEATDVIVATVAFGMGIDRGDVRCVIHAGMPKSIEHYQQEAGRAGRDGLAAECVLLDSPADAIKWEQIILRSRDESEPDRQVSPAVTESMLRRLSEMRAYCTQARCRHAQLVEYFGQRWTAENCGACDQCLGERERGEDVSVLAQKILSCVARCRENFGAGHILEVLRGARTAAVLRHGHERLSTHGLLKELAPEQLRAAIYQLMDQGILSRSIGEFPVLKLNEASWQVLRGERQVHFAKAPATVKSAARGEADWAGVDLALFEKLRALRRELAGQRGVPAYLILGDAALRDIARRLPRSSAELAGISGIGPQKLAEFGPGLLGVVCEHVGARPGAPLAPPHACAPEVPPPSREDVAAPRAASTEFAPRTGPRTTRQTALQRFAAGASVEAVMRETGRARSTVMGYLAEHIEAARPESIERWLPPELHARIAAAIEQVGQTRLRPVFEQLNQEVPYDQIRLVFAHAGIRPAPPESE